ncbi:MAG: helix-turn-helix domain-containing protein [Chloroflexota bacterium]|nr:helix-turn-helix domain-containing protein [Chloroflexota bacterium]
MPTLDERFKGGPPTREPADAHAWLSAEERRFILWGLKEQWSALRIGRALGVNEATVRRFRKRFWEEPRLLLELGLYEMVGSVRTPEYRCLVCGEQALGRLATERHVLRHYLEEAVVMATLPEVASNSAHQSQDQEGGEKKLQPRHRVPRRQRRL